MTVKIKFDNTSATIVHFPDQEGYDTLRNSLLLRIPGAEYQYKVRLRSAIQTLLTGRMESGDDIRLYTDTLKSSRDRYVRRQLNQFANRIDAEEIHDVPAFLREMDARYGDDGYVCLVNEEHRFLTGLLPEIVQALEQTGYSVELEDNRTVRAFDQLSPAMTNPGEIVVSLRDYQIEAVQKAFTNSFKDVWWPRGVLKMATGSGKTETAICMYQMTKVPSVFLVHRKDLLQQAAERFDKYNIPVGMIGGNNNYVNRDGITVATLQTLWARHKAGELDQDWLASVEQIFLDEAHLMAASMDKANTFVQVVNFFPNAYLRWGLTATPFMKEDEFSNRLLMGVAGDVLVEISNAFLIEQGHLTPPEVRMTHVVHPSMFFDELAKGYISYEGGTWAEVEDFVIVRSEARNRAVVKDLIDAPKPCLLLIRRKEHVPYLEMWCRALGVEMPPVLSGTSSKDQRRQGVADLRSGKVDALIATTIFDEGIDIPELRSVIMAGGGKSHIKTLQRTGRGLRKAEGKDKVVIYDYLDASISTPSWNPLKHSKQRRKFYKDEGFEFKEIKP